MGASEAACRHDSDLSKLSTVGKAQRLLVGVGMILLKVANAVGYEREEGRDKGRVKQVKTE